MPKNPDLTPAQRQNLALIEKFGMIKVGDRDQLPGLHFCPDHDRKAICRGTDEWSTCSCESYKEAVQ